MTVHSKPMPRDWLKRRVGKLLEGCATSSLAFRRFPSPVMHAGSLTILFCMIGLWATQQSSDRIVLNRSLGLVSDGDPALAATISYLVLMIYVLGYGFSRGKRSRGASVATLVYLTLGLAVSWAWVLAISKVVSFEIDPPQSNLWISSSRGFTNIAGSSVNCFVTLQVIILVVIISTWRARSLKAWAAAVSAGSLALGASVLSLSSDGSQAAGSLLVAGAIGIAIAELLVVLTFCMRHDGPAYTRAMTDSVAVWVCVVLGLFYYADSPGWLLASVAPMLGLIAAVLVIDDWGHPREPGE